MYGKITHPCVEMTFVTISEKLAVLYDEHRLDGCWVCTSFAHVVGKENWNYMLTLLHDVWPMKRATAADLMTKIKTDVNDLMNMSLKEPCALASFMGGEINRMKKAFV